MTETKIVLCTGGFDPVHSGHINLFKAAKERGDILAVGVNSDEWLSRKKGRPFMPFSERINIIQNLKDVDIAFGFDDNDGSAIDAINVAKERWPGKTIVFANGGDRNSSNIPEMSAFANDPLVEFEFGVGGNNKANSSSWILNEWKSPKTIRPWGYYRNLYQDGPNTRVKELAVNPGEKLSMQRHRLRSEFWMVTDGQATVNLSNDDPNNYNVVTLTKHEYLYIPQGTWHQLENKTNQPLKIVEIQYGQNCMEEDIERVGVNHDYGVSLYDK